MQRGLLAGADGRGDLRRGRLLRRAALDGLPGRCLAHAILPGVAVAYLMGGNLTSARWSRRSLVALGIGALSARRQIKEDTAIGILFAAALSLGRGADLLDAHLRGGPQPHPLRQRPGVSPTTWWLIGALRGRLAA